jgi:hypothetical protein
MPAERTALVTFVVRLRERKTASSTLLRLTSTSIPSVTTRIELGR